MTDNHVKSWLDALAIAADQMTEVIRSAPVDADIGWLIAARDHADDARAKLLEHLDGGTA